MNIIFKIGLMGLCLSGAFFSYALPYNIEISAGYYKKPDGRFCAASAGASPNIAPAFARPAGRMHQAKALTGDLPVCNAAEQTAFQKKAKTLRLKNSVQAYKTSFPLLKAVLGGAGAGCIIVSVMQIIDKMTDDMTGANRNEDGQTEAKSSAFCNTCNALAGGLAGATTGAKLNNASSPEAKAMGRSLQTAYTAMETNKIKAEVLQQVRDPANISRHIQAVQKEQNILKIGLSNAQTNHQLLANQINKLKKRGWVKEMPVWKLSAQEQARHFIEESTKQHRAAQREMSLLQSSKRFTQTELAAVKPPTKANLSSVSYRSKDLINAYLQDTKKKIQENKHKQKQILADKRRAVKYLNGSLRVPFRDFIQTDKLNQGGKVLKATGLLKSKAFGRPEQMASIQRLIENFHKSENAIQQTQSEIIRKQGELKRLKNFAAQPVKGRLPMRIQQTAQKLIDEKTKQIKTFAKPSEYAKRLPKDVLKSVLGRFSGPWSMILKASAWAGGGAGLAGGVAGGIACENGIIYAFNYGEPKKTEL